MVTFILMSRWILIAIFWSLGGSAIAQHILYLKKLGGSRSVKYQVQDEIKFQLRGDTYFTSGKIEGFGSDYFIIHETEVYLKDIWRFDISDKNVTYFSFRSSPGKLMFAGILLPLADFTNQTVVAGNSASWPPNSIIIASGSLILAGLGLRLIAPRYFKLGTRRIAVIIEKSDTENSILP